MRRPPSLSRAMLGFMTGRCVYCTDKAKRLLGWAPRFSLDEGFQCTEEWLREIKMID
jgi:nucleoside-diphosphate-sugar epimerase